MAIGSIEDFENYPLAEMGQEITRIRQVKTADGMGGTIANSESTELITLIIANLTAKDREVSSLGYQIHGNKKIFFRYSDDIIIGDIIVDSSSREWRVEEITAEYNGVFKTAIIKSIAGY